MQARSDQREGMLLSQEEISGVDIGKEVYLWI